MVYSHDVIETNGNFNLLGIGERLPPVLLQIEIGLLNKYLSQNIKIKNLFINIESWSNFIKLVHNSALKKIIDPRDRGIFFWIFLFLFVSSSLVSVVSLSTTWKFASNPKELTVLLGLSVGSSSSGAMNYVSKSFINSSVPSSLSLCTTSNNVNPWSVELPLSVWKCLFWLLLIFKFFTYQPVTTALQLRWCL